ncbi:hypothetical protein ScPMuIL_017380 [Solemya velum]
MGGTLTSLKKTLLQKRMADEKYEFPRTLEEFGYAFNEEGELRDVKTGNRFEFKVEADNHRYNQARYNALGDIITRYIYKIMESEYGLRRVYLPEDAAEDEPKTLIFLSDDALTNPDKLLLLVHGSGAVRAGQWARSIIINDDLHKGSQLPYIKWALDEGYGLIVFNTNINSVDRNGEEVKIRGHSSPEEHFKTVWEDFVGRAKAKNIGIVAHSYGGAAVLENVRLHTEQFLDRVFALAMTDSVHALLYRNEEQEMEAVFPKDNPRITDERVLDFYIKRAMNWASAFDPLDTPLKTSMDKCPTVSAGTDKHEYTSDSCKASVFKWLTEALEKRLGLRSEPTASNGVKSEESVQSQSEGKTEAMDSKASPVVTDGSVVPTHGDKQGAEEVLTSKTDADSTGGLMESGKTDNSEAEDKKNIKNIDSSQTDSTDKKEEL